MLHYHTSEGLPSERAAQHAERIQYFGGLPGCLPEGSMVMYGSLSQLAKRGLENYSVEYVKIKKVITNVIPKSCTRLFVTSLPLPLHR
jgi:hypothetical protein